MLGIDLERADRGFADDLRIVAAARRAGSRSSCCAPTSPACRSSGSTTRKRRDSTTRSRSPTPAARCSIELYGGVNARSGRRTVLEVNSIVATVGHTGNPGNTRHDYVPPLNNQTLFRRDAYLCMYCAQRFPARELSRDHIRPFSQGGIDVWTNVVAACRRCNNQKASRTPEQAKMQLIAVPFTPTYAEYIFLKGRRVLADQMEYLLAHFPRTQPAARSHPALAALSELRSQCRAVRA